MIKLEDISLSFGSQIIFDNQSCNIAPHQKIGLVGRNGAGKSTLLKVISGQQHLDSGKVYIPKTFKCAYMSQDMTLISQRSIINEAVCSDEKIGKLVDEYCSLDKILHGNFGQVSYKDLNLLVKGESCDKSVDEKDCVKHGYLESGSGFDKNHDLMARYAHVYSELSEIDYENRCLQAKKILLGLGFSQNQFQDPVSNLSVGWKMRLVLAKLLLENADFYLFDEPTNHLDLIAKDWFLDFLKNARFGFVLVSHDRYFLDNVCDYICDVSMGKLVFYTGNYSKYIVQKEEDKALLEKKYEEQQKMLKKKMETIDRFRYKASKAKMAQSMIKALDKIERIELEPEPDAIGFKLKPTGQSGKVVLTVKGLEFSYNKNGNSKNNIAENTGDKKIFSHVSFEINRGNKVAIIAPNGTGKSTLLNIIMGRLKQQNGSIEFGYNVEPVFFEQDQNKSLDQRSTVFEEAESVCKTEEQRLKVRGLLGAFLFSGDDVNKKIAVLSGGEKNRVAMVKVLLQGGNFLILDEPTNHLDIQSKNILLNVLQNYDGTILFVSHDRSFLNSLATDILELTHEGVFAYKGNYDEYLYHKKFLESEFLSKDKAEKARLASVVQDSDKKNKAAEKACSGEKINGLNSYEQQKEIKKLEAAVEKFEREIKALLLKFEKISYGTKEYCQAQEKLKELQAKLDEKTACWEKLIS